MNQALGLIEVIGYVAAIEAADAAVKAANIELLGVDKVTDGILTVKFIGDVGAVKAAVDAGALAVDSVGILRAAHVIPRMHQEVTSIIEKRTKKIEKEVIIKAEEIVNTEEPVEPEAEEIVEESSPTNKQVTMDSEKLSSMSVAELKNLIKSLAIPMAAKKLKTVKKDELINILLKFYKEADK